MMALKCGFPQNQVNVTKLFIIDIASIVRNSYRIMFNFRITYIVTQFLWMKINVVQLLQLGSINTSLLLAPYQFNNIFQSFQCDYNFIKRLSQNFAQIHLQEQVELVSLKDSSLGGKVKNSQILNQLRTCLWLCIINTFESFK